MRVGRTVAAVVALGVAGALTQVGAGAPVAGAAACSTFDISGTWDFVNPNRQPGAGHEWTVTFHQAADGTLTGEEDHPAADVQEFGYPAGTTWTITSGSVEGTRAVWETTPSQPKTDGTGKHTGHHEATIEPGSAPNSGMTSDGVDYDKQVPSSHGTFTGSGPAVCEGSGGGGGGSGGGVTTIPSPPRFGVVTGGPAPAPGGAAVVKSPPLSGVAGVIADIAGLTVDDRAALATKQRQCFTNFTSALVGWGAQVRTEVTRSVDDDGIDGVLLGAIQSNLTLCLQVVDALAASYAADHGQAAAVQPCLLPQMTLVTTGSGASTRLESFKLSRKGSAITATCKRVGNRLQIHLVARHHRRLKSILGSRLRLVIHRVKTGQAGGSLAVRFKKG